MNHQVNQEMEIDVLSLVKALWKKKFLIVVMAILSAVLMLGYSMLLVTPRYDSTTRIYVVNRQSNESSVLTNQDLQAGSYLVKDYKEIILSQDVLQKSIDSLGLSLMPNQLAAKIKVVVPTDTRIISITVSDKNADEAARIVNMIRQKAADKIIEVTKVSDVTTLEEGIPALNPSSPNIKRNVLLGFVAGGILMSVVVLVIEVLDDRIKRPEDIEEAMGLTLLGIVPNIDKLQ